MTADLIPATESTALAAMIATSVGFAAAAALTLFLIYGWVTGISGRAVLAAASATLGWQALLLLEHLLGQPTHAWAQALEVLAYCLWLIVCLRAVGVGPEHLSPSRDRARSALLLATASVIALALGSALLALVGFTNGELITFSSRLIAAITGLVLLEQIARNTRRGQHWNLKFLVVGLGVVFAYAVVLFADAILFKRPEPALVAMQGLAVALATPFIAVASLRNRDQKLAVNVSRRLVFHTGALLLTGGYLLVVAAAGYWIRVFGGTWGQLLVVPFVLFAVVVGIVFAASRTQRERFERFVTRNLFADKHDYRERWLAITNAMQAASDETTIAERALVALGDLVSAHRGALFRRGRADVLHPLADVKSDWTMPFSPIDSRCIIDYFEEIALPLVVDDALISKSDLERRVGEIIGGLPEASFAVPLMLADRLWGLAVLTRPETGGRIDSEDEEILGVAARQIASHLAQDDAHAALAEARQLTAFNQMTAFVVHDIKTVVAQLSLMSRNAVRHRDNPKFITDMIATTEHAVRRMQALLAQLKDPSTGDRSGVSSCDVRALLDSVTERCKGPPHVECRSAPEGVWVTGDYEELAAALAHLVRNAQEAATPEGSVRIEAAQREDWVSVSIHDDGPGMSDHFVATRLFKPFESSKGLTGMGIGAWQAREAVRQIGGDIRVTSAPGEGTTLEVLLPATAAPGHTVQPRQGRESGVAEQPEASQ